MNKVDAYKVVFDDLKNIEIFMGKYDAKNSNEAFMYGISTVMELIASNISDEAANNYIHEFSKNIANSNKKAGI